GGGARPPVDGEPESSIVFVCRSCTKDESSGTRAHAVASNPCRDHFRRQGGFSARPTVHLVCLPPSALPALRWRLREPCCCCSCITWPSPPGEPIENR